jgi:hypothetical protein
MAAVIAARERFERSGAATVAEATTKWQPIGPSAAICPTSKDADRKRHAATPVLSVWEACRLRSGPCDTTSSNELPARMIVTKRSCPGPSFLRHNQRHAPAMTSKWDGQTSGFARDTMFDGSALRQRP